jgi:effector-binding domain-containing protein
MMKLSEITIEQRDAQPYVAIRSRVSMEEIPVKLPPLHDEVFDWLKSRGIEMAGPPFFRYLGGNMSHMEVDVGVPVATPVEGDGRVIVDTLPTGRYAVILHTGDYSTVVQGSIALLDWSKANNIAWVRSDDGVEERWGARVEHYITDPGEEPDSSKWETEVAFLLEG